MNVFPLCFVASASHGLCPVTLLLRAAIPCLLTSLARSKRYASCVGLCAEPDGMAPRCQQRRLLWHFLWSWLVPVGWRIGCQSDNCASYERMGSHSNPHIEPARTQHLAQHRTASTVPTCTSTVYTPSAIRKQQQVAVHAQSLHQLS